MEAGRDPRSPGAWKEIAVDRKNAMRLQEDQKANLKFNQTENKEIANIKKHNSDERKIFFKTRTVKLQPSRRVMRKKRSYFK